MSAKVDMDVECEGMRMPIFSAKSWTGPIENDHKNFLLCLCLQIYLHSLKSVLLKLSHSGDVILLAAGVSNLLYCIDMTMSIKELLFFLCPNLTAFEYLNLIDLFIAAPCMISDSLLFELWIDHVFNFTFFQLCENVQLQVLVRRT